jgi:hypothetical protein
MCWSSWLEPQSRRRVAKSRILEWFNHPERIEVHRDGSRLAVGDERPREPLLPEVFRHRNREDAPLASRQEVSWLTLIGPAWVNPVVRTDRNINRLFRVPIEIADEQLEGAVGALVPALKGACHALS